MSPSRVRRFACAASLLATLLLSACIKQQEFHYAPPPPPSSQTQDFDVHYAATLDPNGAARNVDWHKQLSGQLPDPSTCNGGRPYDPGCTQYKPFKDQPDGGYEAACFLGKVSAPPYQPFFGHADWMVAQYNGSIGWFNYGTDDDYGLFLIPASDNLPPATNAPLNAHGLTTNNSHVNDDNKNQQYMEMEYDSVETDPAFKNGWWSKFRTAAEKDNNYDEVQALLHPNKSTLACGSALGLFGLDCDHGCRSELHPVYGIAIQTVNDPNDNEWSVMARNWGTGGFCSRYNDELAETSLSLLLPYQSSQPPTKIEIPEFYPSALSGSQASIGCPSVYFDNGQTIVNITLPPPEQRPVAAFTLKIQWPSGALPVACTQPYTSPSLLAAKAESAKPLNGEDYMSALLKAAYQSQHPGAGRPTIEKDILPEQPQTQSHLHALLPMAEAPPKQPCAGITVTPKIGPVPPPPVVTTVHRLQKDPRKQARDQYVRNYICQAYKTKPFDLPAGTTQQDFDQVCKGVKYTK